MNRTECLESALKIVNGQREQEYGKPEDNFGFIANLWTAYLGNEVTSLDVTNMMVLFKIARTKTGRGNDDSFVDIAGYAACGAEVKERYDRMWEDE